MPAPLGQHQRDGIFAGVEAAVQMGGHDAAPLLRCHILQQAHMGDPGVVDQYVQAADVGEQGCYCLPIPGVRSETAAAHAVGAFQFLSQFFQFFHMMQAGQDQVISRSGKSFRHGPSYASGRPGNQCGLIHMRYNSFLLQYNYLQSVDSLSV